MIFIPSQESQHPIHLDSILEDDVSPHLWKNLIKANIRYKQQLHTILAVSRQAWKTGKVADYQNTHFTRKDIDEILELLATISN